MWTSPRSPRLRSLHTRQVDASLPWKGNSGMPEVFSGRWRLRVTEQKAGVDQRVRITGADSGGGVYPGVPGTTLEVSGNNWAVALEWNDGAGSGWWDSTVLRSVSSLSPLVITHILSAGEDFQDLIVTCEDLDPIFDIVQRPFALDREALTMTPDGIFDTSQDVQYMGVRVRNTWEFDWGPATGVMIGIADSSRAALASQGIQVIDGWSAGEQGALQQEMLDGFACVPSLGVGEERVVYFKLDVSNAGPGKPVIRFVAQRDDWDPAYDQLARQVGARIFISRSTYVPAERELVTETPESAVYMRLAKVIADQDAMQDALVVADRRQPLAVGESRDDHWRNYRPLHWLPVEFEYRVVPNPPYAGQFGPLAFDDPWWKVVLVTLAVHLAPASLIHNHILQTTISGDESSQIDFQIDACSPLGSLRINAPDTLAGSLLASSTVSAALFAALSDEIDPTREGQEATVPPAGAITLEEYTRVAASYSEVPRPGTPFNLKVAWEYERRTDKGTLTHSEVCDRQNQHVLLYHRLFTDRPSYSQDDTIRLFGLVVPTDDHDQKRLDCGAYHCVAVLHPTSVDRSYPFILRAINELPDAETYLSALWGLLEAEDLSDEERQLLTRQQRQIYVYYGERPAAGLSPGPWVHWMHVQTVNTVRPGTNPLIAAQTIGGLPLSNHYRGARDSASGPFFFEDDGSFQIEPVSR